MSVKSELVGKEEFRVAGGRMREGDGVAGVIEMHDTHV